MRTDPRYTRVRAMITHESIPRTDDGGIQLCHLCQRRVHLRGGFLRLLQWTLDHAARYRGRPPAKRMRDALSKIAAA